ncbi:MAG: dihydrofolate reductase [Candidatus Woesearchaeota archaeon]
MIKIIVAMTSSRVIGNQGKIPWHYSEDFLHFKKETEGSVVVMGRKTYESIGRPLPNRVNIVISSKLEDEKVEVARSFEEALEKAKKYDKDIFLIGGSLVYEKGLEVADEVIISYIKKNFEGDTYFPKMNYENYKMYKTKNYEDFDVKWYKRK